MRNKHKLIDIRRPGKQRDEPSAVVADVMTNPMGQYSDEGASNQQVTSRIVRSNTIEQKPITLDEALFETGKTPQGILFLIVMRTMAGSRCWCVFVTVKWN